jgi:hypothetical protein
MNLDTSALIIALSASILSGSATALFAAFRDAQKEKTRKLERYQDSLKLELKDLKIKLYELEKELTGWKDKYYSAIQELIEVKAELEKALVQLNLIEISDADKEY